MTVEVRPATRAAIEQAFCEHYPAMLSLAWKRFRLPEEDAEQIAQEIFLELLARPRPVEKMRLYLLAAMAKACLTVIQRRRPEQVEGLDLDLFVDGRLIEVSADVARRLLLREVGLRLSDRCREVLGRHYMDGQTAPEIARDLDTTPRYAEILIQRCLKKAKEIYRLIASTR